MSSEIRKCVTDLNKNKDVLEMLPKYLEQSMQVHGDYGKVKMMMEYYIFYEMISEGINPYIDTAKDISIQLHELIALVFDDKQKYRELSDSMRQDTEVKLLQLREVVTEKMNVLTAYVDRFVIYEYILNRVQYRFEDQEMLAEDTVFAQEVLNYIFSSKDNMVVNENIRAVLGQLPMRMTRSHYYDLIRDSLSVYKDSDASALEGYLYMFRTNAMLYHTEGMDQYFTEFVPVLKELEELDYSQMNKETYQIYEEKIRINATRLNDISDLYMLIQQLINEVYTVAVSAPYTQESDVEQVASRVILGIHDLFTHEGKYDWSLLSGESVETDEEKLAALGDLFPTIEGKQEQYYESINMVDAILEETMEVQKEQIASLGMEEAYRKLNHLQQMASNSAFAELETDIAEDKLTADQVADAAEQLIGELKDLFKKSSRAVRRAIMANTLEKMPVFFTSSKEVADYLVQSLSMCDDEAEKYASKQLIQSLME